MAADRFTFSEQDCHRIKSMLLAYERGEMNARPRHRRKEMPWQYPSDGMDSMFGMAVANIDGFKDGVYSSGDYYYAKLTPATNPTTFTAESLTDTSKRVTAFNISSLMQLKDKAAVLFKQPNGQWFAYPWWRQSPRARVYGSAILPSMTAPTTYTWEDFAHSLSDGIAIDWLGDEATISSHDKFVFANSQHGIAHGYLQFTANASTSNTVAELGQVTLSLAFTDFATPSAPSFYWPYIQPKNGDNAVIYKLPFWFNWRCLQGGYWDNAIIDVASVNSGSVTAMSVEITFYCHAGNNTPNGFGT